MHWHKIAGKTFVIQNGSRYTDELGNVKCGIVYQDGNKKQSQTCMAKMIVGNNNNNDVTHQINPYRTIRERQLIKEFELDHE